MVTSLYSLELVLIITVFVSCCQVSEYVIQCFKNGMFHKVFHMHHVACGKD